VAELSRLGGGWLGWVVSAQASSRAGEAEGKQPAQVQCGDRIDSHTWLRWMPR